MNRLVVLYRSFGAKKSKTFRYNRKREEREEWASGRHDRVEASNNEYPQVRAASELASVTTMLKTHATA